MKLLLIRHAESIKNKQNRHGLTETDWPLTPNGFRTATDFAKELAKYVKLDAIYCTNTRASKQTADCIASNFNLPTIIENEFRSIDFGIVSGLKMEEIAVNHPDIFKQICLYHKGNFHPKEYNIPQSEKHGVFEDRIRKALKKISRSPSNVMALVCHRSTITMLVSIIENFPNTTAQGKYRVIELPSLSITEIEIPSEETIGRVVSCGIAITDFARLSILKSVTYKCRKRLKVEKNDVISLGISVVDHDSAAAVFRNGRLLAAAEEERFTRIKNTSEFPINAVLFCLYSEGLRTSDINNIAIPSTITGFGETVAKIFETHEEHRIDAKIVNLADKLSFMTRIRLEEILGISISESIPISYYDHHESHAASAYYFSEFENAAVLVIDGVGEIDTISIYKGEGPKIVKLESVKYPNSIGKIYGAVCRYLGFDSFSKEGTVMALAAYGKPIYLERLRKYINLSTGLPILIDGLFNLGLSPLSPSKVSHTFEKQFGPARINSEKLEQRHFNMAASIQLLLEEVLLAVCQHVKEITNEENLCYAGGVALNCKANSTIRHSGIFKSIYIPPCPHDAGLAVGSAAISQVNLGKSIDKITGYSFGYTGAQYTDYAIKSELEKFQSYYKHVDQVAKQVAIHLADGQAIGWFQSRAEFGHRALGNRSILGDPRNTALKERINKSIKNRESFRPLAPAVLGKFAKEYFGCTESSYFMLDSFFMCADFDFPAVTHIDDSSRIQTVTKESNPEFYKLMQEFYKLTGVPLLLNTSLNLRDEPIVNSPADAINLFNRSNLDLLVIGNYIVYKN